jgi:three-Cys-motif partner protein
MHSLNDSLGSSTQVEPRERRFFNTISRRQWTWIKHTILGRYLRPWSMKVGTLADTIWVLDCFAGAASYEDVVTGERVDGSPVISALEARRYAEGRPGKQMGVICVERNRKNYADLVERMSGFSDVVTTFRGSFARHLEAITTMIGDDPALIFLDPIGLKAITAEACRGLLERKGKTDIFVIVDFGIVHRTRGQLLSDGRPNSEIPGAAANAANIDAFFGGSRRWRSVDRRLPVVDRERAYMHIYFEDVLGGWFAFTSACPVRGSYEATPEYWMVHAASHVDAHLLMNDEIAKVDKQLYLRTYGENALPEVVEQLYQAKVRKRLDALEHDVLEYVRAAGTSGASFEAIVLGTLPRHFGQVKVGKWAGDYARTIRKLIDHGQLRRQKDRLAAAFDRRERIIVASTSEEKRPAV